MSSPAEDGSAQPRAVLALARRVAAQELDAVRLVRFRVQVRVRVRVRVRFALTLTLTLAWPAMVGSWW